MAPCLLWPGSYCSAVLLCFLLCYMLYGKFMLWGISNSSFYCQMFKCMKWLLLWRTSFSTGLAPLIKASVVCFLDLDKCFCSVVGPCSLQLSLVGKAHLKCNHISTFYLSSYHCNIGLMLFVVVFSILAQLNGHFSSVFFLVLKKTRIRQVLPLYPSICFSQRLA